MNRSDIAIEVEILGGGHLQADYFRAEKGNLCSMHT